MVVSDKLVAKNSIKWSFINKSVQGASHVRKNIPCQDYSLCQNGEDGSLPLILTVSDGHGGSRYMRSAQGAVYACESAMNVVSDYAVAVLTKTDANLIRQLSETRIKVDIVKKWQNLCLDHAKANPFTDDDLALLGITKDECDNLLFSAETTDKEPILAAYGATLLIAIILDDVIICEQIGDGDILFFYKNRKQKVITPVEKDEALFANETTSLCSLKAPFYFRHSVVYLYDKSNMPDLIMLATDGYSNSFNSTDDYYKTAADYYKFLKDEGADFVGDNIEKWLVETTNEGSGDDITIVLAWTVC